MTVGTGLSLEISQKSDNRLFGAAFKLMLILAMFFGAAGSFLNMAGLTGLFVYLIPAAVIGTAEMFICRSRKLELCFYAATGIILLVMIAVCRQQLHSGMGTFFNAIFEASENQQSYMYDRFTANGSNADIIFFILPVSIAIAAQCSFSVRKRNVASAFAVFAVCAGVQVYFGVFADTVWLLLLFFAFALFTAYAAGSKALPPQIILTVLLILAVTATFTLYSGKSETLASWSESVRDRFDEPYSPPDASGMSAPDKNPRENRNDGANDTDDGADAQSEHIGAIGSTIGVMRRIKSPALTLLFIFIAIVLLYVIIRYGIRAFRISRFRARFSNPDVNTAVKSMFHYLIAVLKTGGLRTQNRDYSEYKNQVAEMTADAHTNSYKNAVKLWQEAEFSEHSMSENQRAEMRGILNEILRKLSDNSTFTGKLRLRLFKRFGSGKEERGLGKEVV